MGWRGSEPETGKSEGVPEKERELKGFQELEEVQRGGGRWVWGPGWGFGPGWSWL